MTKSVLKQRLVGSNLNYTTDPSICVPRRLGWSVVHAVPMAHASSHSQMRAVLPWEFWGRDKNSPEFQMGAFLRISVSQCVSTLELGH